MTIDKFQFPPNLNQRSSVESFYSLGLVLAVVIIVVVVVDVVAVAVVVVVVAAVVVVIAVVVVVVVVMALANIITSDHNQLWWPVLTKLDFM